MFIHSVYFWFKEGTAPERIAEFEGALKRLTTISQAKTAYFGRPEQTPPREVVDSTFTWALVVMFDDVESHNIYQKHAIHDEFVAEWSGDWERAQIYDTRCS